MTKKMQRHSGLYLFSLFGFKVSLDWSWLFLAILITWSLAAGYFPLTFPHLDTETYWLMGVVGALGLFFSIILHELCHSLVARHYGQEISGITLFIFGGVAEMRDAPPNPKTEFLMALAGPMFSIAAGLVFTLLYQLGVSCNWPVPVNGVLSYLGVINIFVGIFNLLPGFPLDGGRIFRSILWWWRGDLHWATRVAAAGGTGLGFGMILLGIVLFIQGAIIGGLWMFLLGFFLQHIAKASYQTQIISDFFRGKQIRKYVTVNPVTVRPDVTVQELVDDYFYKYHHKLYPVMANEKLLGCVSMGEVQKIHKEKWGEMRVEQIMSQCSDDNTLDASADVTTVLQTMLSQRLSRFIVTDRGKLLGVVTLKDLTDVITIKLGLEQ